MEKRVKLNRRSFLMVLLLVYGVVLITVVPAGAKSYEISNYDIEMELTAEGDYLVTETLTYNFIEGQFSWASREISGRGFSGLKFISLRGAGTGIADYKVEKGRNLKIRWEFPGTGQPATFILKYRAEGGLASSDGQNVIDWNPVGSDWDVPIRDLDIEITLPKSMESIDIAPRSDLTANENNRVIHFHYDRLSPGTYYHLKIAFPEFIEMIPREEGFSGREFLPYLVGGLLAGILILILDIIRGLKEKPAPEPSAVKPESLALSELASIYYSTGTEARRGVTAEIFSLARNGKVKLISRLKKGAFGSHRSEVQVEVLSEEGLNEVEKLITRALKEAGDLKKFARNYNLFKRVAQKVKTLLEEKGLISAGLVYRRKRILFTSLILAVVGAISLVSGLVRPLPPALAAAVIFFVSAFGRLIRAALTPILSAEGIYLQEEVSRYLDDQKGVLDGLVTGKKAAEALNYFFARIEYLILHRKFNSSSFNKYKKVFKEADSFKMPAWLELDVSELDTTLEALEIVDVVNYVLISTVFVTASTGTTAAGAGAPGSGAGGGGGAAG